MMKYLFICATVAVFLGKNFCWAANAPIPGISDQEKDFMLVKNEIVQRLGAEYRRDNFRFTEKALNREVYQREYLYDNSKK
ncbi:hypothetical protein [Candidatus Paracaedibacter symbiosus]|uniref:hypothetical protein n=1 Tax=Candidatus Paracaedibacter symbiosus TaxID=244582 RepID=UPI00050949A9|nr:hypothetical protein [Candidatus Paracaedibacter symbiosus]